ncbi:MAG: zinc ribbon domain-containing protein [Sedimentisphaeraceae bacterium JB056]
MGPVLKGLIELQSVESRLRGMKTRLKRFKKAVVLQQKQLKKLEDEKQACKDSIIETKSNIDSLELELKSRDDTVNKYKEALNKAKNNKEYAAILTELNTNKADNSKIESRILEYMDTIEQAKTASEKLDEDMEKQKALIEEIKAKAADKISECEEGIAEIEQLWQQAASELPADALNLFQKLSDTYDGEAVATVQQSGGRIVSYSCGGCFMSVTAETINQLMAKDEVSQCKNCGRILVIKESEQG